MDQHRNRVITESLPIDKSIKRYYVCKWNYLIRHNGLVYASDVFKDMKEIVQEYIADPVGIRNRRAYAQRFPIRNKWRALQLLKIAQSRPHVVLDFLKLYTGLDKPVVTPGQAAYHQMEYLSTRHEVIDSQIPIIFINFMQDMKKGNLLGNICSNIAKHTLCLDNDIEPPLPDWYKDCDDKGFSDSYEFDEIDFEKFYSSVIVLANREDHPRTDLYKIIRARLQMFYPEGPSDFMLDSAMDKTTNQLLNDEVLAGQVHFIPKKGTVKRRPIAVPNRFFQSMLKPLKNYLYTYLEYSLGNRDCTFDQSKFDYQIQNRIDTGAYVGSVDLSQATDNLPYSWTRFFIDQIILNIPKEYSELQEQLQDSKIIFETLLKMKWECGNFKVRWDVGQPLGTWPSFAMLGITHNFICEAITYDLYKKGRISDYDTYRVVGDDVIFFDKTVRDEYIKLMQDHGIPLSLHKSYEYDLVEFAGKFFIKNQQPRFVSDHSVITWPSLFDYQRATGMRIPWDRLPSSIKKRWIRTFDCNEHMAQKGYKLISASVCDVVLSSLGAEQQAFLGELYSVSEDLSPDPELKTGIIHTNLGLSHHGESKSHRATNWYKQKFRPVSTDRMAVMAKSILSV